MTHDDVRALLLSFPGVEDGVSYGEPSFKVAGRFFTWMFGIMSSVAPEVVVLMQ